MSEPFKPGDKVLCWDDSNGSHFLYFGHTYIVDELQTSELDGVTRVLLVGMAKMWELDRFELVGYR